MSHPQPKFDRLQLLNTLGNGVHPHRSLLCLSLFDIVHTIDITFRAVGLGVVSDRCGSRKERELTGFGKRKPTNDSRGITCIALFQGNYTIQL